jgi:hypothetical protein
MLLVGSVMSFSTEIQFLIVVVQLAGRGEAVWGDLHPVRHVGIRRRS